MRRRSRDLFLTDDATSARMAGVRQRDTRPEIAVRKALWSLGKRYRIRNRDLPGSPDIANRKERWAIFVHGCFWHRHPGCRRSTTPKQNRALWNKKFRLNVARDAAKAELLRNRGFEIITIWECETELAADLRARLLRDLKRLAQRVRHRGE